MAVIRHLGFLKFAILPAGTVRKSSMRHCAKFRADRSNRCRDMAIFIIQDGGRPPFWISFTRLV